MLAYFGGFWDDWNLLHKVTFDGENRLIIIAPGVTDIDVKVDIYSDWKEWVRVRDYSKYPRALRTIGGDATTPGERAGDLYFLMNGWRIRTWEGSHELSIDGVINVDGTADPGFDQLGRSTGSISVPTLKPQFIQITRKVSSLVTTVEVASSGSLGGGFEQTDRDTLNSIDSKISSISPIIGNLPDSGSLSTIDTNIRDVLATTRITLTYITSGGLSSVETTLTEPDNFYDGMGVIITSGSVGVTRQVDSYIQTSGTLIFTDELPFVPVSGSQLTLLTRYDHPGGGIA